MKEEFIRHDDPYFLLSRSIDERLTEKEQRQLSDALIRDPKLREEKEKIQKIDEFVRATGREPVNIDWQAHAALIQDRIATSEESLTPLDGLLERVREETGFVEHVELTEGVLRRIRQELTPARSPIRIFRLVAPLAAAAAIVVMVYFGVQPRAADRLISRVVDIGPVGVVSHETSMSPEFRSPAKRVALVMFDRTPVRPVESDNRVIGISFLSAGGSLEEFAESGPPL